MPLVSPLDQAVVRPVSLKLVQRLASDFFQRSHAVFYLGQTAAPQRDHAALDSFLFQLHGRSADQDQLANLIVNFHDFIKARAPLVAGAVAVGATLAFEDLYRLGLFRRKPS